LRAIRGRFVVFDLDSAGGTWVNGQRVLQHTLVPGDVISLSGVPLVYGQDSVGQDETQDINPIPG
jgi:pSer/pThr/pTyr-binding forkhead associated (FHA) protein